MLELYLIGAYLVFTTQLQQCQSKSFRDAIDLKTIWYISAGSWLTIMAQALIMYVHNVIERYQGEDDE